MDFFFLYFVDVSGCFSWCPYNVRGSFSGWWIHRWRNRAASWFISFLVAAHRSVRRRSSNRPRHLLIRNELSTDVAASSWQCEVVDAHRPRLLLISRDHGVVDGSAVVRLSSGRLLVPERPQQLSRRTNVGNFDDCWMGATLSSRGCVDSATSSRKFRLWSRRRAWSSNVPWLRQNLLRPVVLRRWVDFDPVNN